MVFWARERLLHMGDLWLTQGPWRILRFVAAAAELWAQGSGAVAAAHALRKFPYEINQVFPYDCDSFKKFSQDTRR